MPHLMLLRSLTKEGGRSSVYTMYTRAHYSSRGSDWLWNTPAPGKRGTQCGGGGLFPLISTQLAFLTPLAFTVRRRIRRRCAAHCTAKAPYMH